MICSECGQANAEAAQFCTACGTALTTGGLTARANPAAPAPIAEPQPLSPHQSPVEPPPSLSDGTAQPDLPPLRVGTNWPDVPPAQEVSSTPPYGVTTTADQPAALAAAPVEPAGQPQKFYGVAPGAVNPFQVTPATIPPYEPASSAPIHGVPPPAPTMASPTTPPPAGYGAAPPLYGAACRVCGNALVANMRECPRCGTPVGMVVNATDPTANSYMPVGGPPAQLAPNVLYGVAALQAVPNTSGQRAPAPADLPTGWNWGAAFVTYFWAAAHRVWWYVGMQTLLIFIMLVVWIAALATNENVWAGLGVLIFILYAAIWMFCRISFGIHGNRMAWRRRRFDNMYQFVDVQEAWKPVGIVIGAIALLCILVFGGLLLLSVIGASMAR